MIRVCPKRDAVCPHGMGCPYVVDRYTCRDENEALAKADAILLEGEDMASVADSGGTASPKSDGLCKSKVRGWRVKDYADGWIYFLSAKDALAEVEAMGGALLEPVFSEREVVAAVSRMCGDA
jgi:hypothetical protein